MTSDVREKAGRRLHCLHAIVGENVRRQGSLGVTLESGHHSGRGHREVVEPPAPLEGEHRVRSPVLLLARLLSVCAPKEGQGSY